jgi:SecD/SecF fusion protein
MQRNYVRGLLICLIPCLLAGYAAVFGKYKLGIDLAGGTILVYEINLERTKQRKDAQGGQAQPGAAAPAAGLDSAEMIQLASQIKRRIDPSDLKNVTVRPLGNSRVEIILPTGGGGASDKANLTAEEVDEVKRRVSQMGVLEFRILANQNDDPEGIEEARRIIDAATPADLEARALKGLPPEGPSLEYNVKINDTDAKVRYVWVELGREERESLNLQNPTDGQNRSPLWLQLAGQRNKTYVHSYGNEGKTASMLLFSRDVKYAFQLEQEAKRKAELVKAGKTEEEAAAEVNEKKVEYYVLTRVSDKDTVKIGGDITLTATSDTDQKTFRPCISFRLNGAGGQQFGRMSERNKPSGSTIRTLAILLDDRIISAPTLNAVITTQGQITGNFQKKTVDRQVMLLRSGALSAELKEKPVSENTIGPTLGQDTIKRGTMAVGAAFIVVLLFMLGYYRFAGMVACIALLANLLLTIGFMVAVNAAFTLPGLAGLVLMLGMAVDANVLIYERLREERNKGANLATAIRNGYDRAFLTIIDTHLTSIFTAVVLYTFGNDNLKGFAISLTVGLIISLFTSLYMTRLMFDYWLHKKWLTQLRMMRLFERPNFNPMKWRFFFFTLTTILTIAGLGLFLFRGPDLLNVDFRGGTVYAGKFRESEERGMTKTSDGKPGLRDLLEKENQEKQLKATKARWLNKPSTPDGIVNTYVYEITYDEGDGKTSTSTVSLTDRPVGADDAAMEADVLARAKHLPDVSVEQMFLSSDPDFGEGKSRYFTVRTTERQPELVRVALDRLLRDKDKTLVAGTVMTVGAINGAAVELTFDRPTSPSYIKDLLDREFAKESAVADTPSDTFELVGLDEPEGGRYKRMRLDVSKNPKLGKLKLGTAIPAGAAVGGPASAVIAARPADQEAVDQRNILEKVLRETKSAFESRPEPERLEVFDSQLAAETRTKAFYAIVASWIAILLYLWFRFGNWTFGLAAVLCLIHDLCFTLGMIAACHYLALIPGAGAIGIQDFKIDLATVAALLTLVGYSVNEIIVNFARIREVRGKSPILTPQMINDSVNQTLSRTILTSMTVFLVSIVLYAFGGEGVHLFAFVMMVGVLISTYSSIFVASPLLLMFGEGNQAGGGEVAAAPTPEAEATEKTEADVVDG